VKFNRNYNYAIGWNVLFVRYTATTQSTKARI